MVMEFLRGNDLGDFLAERGPLPVEQAVDFMLQVADAVAEAHALGVVHRDLKPANLFVLTRPNGSHLLKVLDFGISKVLDPRMQSGVTHTSTIMGSPFYMSPEQLRSTRDVDVRSDIWALGVILYELLAGGTPFQGDTMPELIHRTIYEPPPPLREARPDVPPELELAIAKCLEKDPARRFQTVGELAGSLVAFAPVRSKASAERISGFARPTAAAVTMVSVADPTTGAAPGAPAAAAKSGREETVRSWTRPEPKRSTKKAAGIVAAGVLVLAAVWLSTRGASSPEAERASRTTPSGEATPAVSAPPVALPVLRPAVEPAGPSALPAVPPPAERADPVEAKARQREANKTSKESSASSKRTRPETSAAPGAPPAAVSQPAPAPVKPSIDSLIDGRK
jgi:serine/threonine-protein kinase